MSTGFNFITKNNSPYVLNLYIDGSNNNCLDTEFINPNPYLGQTFTINPHATFTAKLFRKDGHGCNGRQGVFQPDPHLSSTTRRSLAPMKDSISMRMAASRPTATRSTMEASLPKPVREQMRLGRSPSLAE